MPILRGHHLICLHFFSGEGYDQTYIDNLRDTLNRVKSEGLTIGTGRDDVCEKCPYMKTGSCQHSENADAEIREMDRKALELLDLSAENRVEWGSLKTIIPALFSEWFSCYCNDCEWLTVCDKNDFFRKVRPVNS